MTNDTAFFTYSTEEDLSYVLEFSGLVLTGRQFEVKIKDRASDTTRATLTLGSGLTITGTNIFEAAYAKAGMVGWPRGEYSADVVDITGGGHSRIMAVRFVRDLPGRLVQGVRDRKAFINWSPNQAVVTATGAIGPAGPKGDTGDTGPANTLSIGTVTTGAAGSSASASITGTAPSQTLSLTIPRGNTGATGATGNTGATGPANSLAIGTVTASAPGSAPTATITGTAPSQTLNLTLPRGDVGPAGSVTDGDKGDIVVSSAGSVWSVDDNAITNPKLRDSAALSVIGRSANSTGDPADIAAGTDGHVLRRSGTSLGFGTVGTAGLADQSVTLAKQANVATGVIMGRATAGTGSQEALTAAQAAALLDAFGGDSGSGGTKGLVPAPAAGDAGKVLGAAGGWVTTPSPALRGHLFGLTLSNNGTDSSNDIDIAAGEAASQDAAPAMMTLASALTKRLDAAWAVGSGNGGLDTGTKANNTWYHVWLIRRANTGAVDALFSTSATAPTMPANYSQRRRIGSVKTDGSGALLGFLQWGDKFIWGDRVVDVNATIGQTYQLLTLGSVPLGVVVEPLLIASTGRSGGTAKVYLASPNVTGPGSVGAFGTWNLLAWGGDSTTGGPAIVGSHLVTNTARQIYGLADAANTSIQIATTGWVDRRGRDA